MVEWSSHYGSVIFTQQYFATSSGITSSRLQPYALVLLVSIERSKEVRGERKRERQRGRVRKKERERGRRRVRRERGGTRTEIDRCGS